MSSKSKGKQTSIKSYFKPMSTDQSRGNELHVLDADREKRQSDDEVVFVLEKQPSPKKRKSKETELEKCKKTKVKKRLRKNPVLKENVVEHCVESIDGFLSLTRNLESSSTDEVRVISDGDHVPFTKLKTQKSERCKDVADECKLEVENKTKERSLDSNYTHVSAECKGELDGSFMIKESAVHVKDTIEDNLHDIFRDVAVKENNVTSCTELSHISSRKTEILFDGKKLHNFVVSSVEKGKNNELILGLKHNELKINCVLRGLWAATSIKIGDSVNVTSNKFDGSTVYIDKNDGMIVVNPEKLVNSTSISSAVFCMRKTWINEKFATYGSANKHMLIGCIVHDLFQTACVKKLKTQQQLQELLNLLTSNAYVLDGCYVNGISVEKLMEDVQQYIPSIVMWLEKYVHNGPSSISKVNDEKMGVVKVLDIEDNYWSTGLGMKGKVDVSLEVDIHEKNKVIKRNVPLELKTGQPSFSFEHQGQVSLYSMMMDSSQSTPCNTGLLLYLKDKPEMKHVQVKPSDRSALIQLRNEFTSYSDDFKIGPPPLNNERLCSRCDCLLSCSLMLKSFNELSLEEPENVSSKLASQATSHLSDTHSMFFKKWVSMTHMEMSMRDRDRNISHNYFWKSTSNQLETKGLAFSDMEFSKNVDSVYTFKKRSSEINLLENRNCNIRVGDRVALSEDKCHSLNPRIAFAIGFVNKIEAQQVEIRLEKLLHESFKTASIRIDFLPVDKSFSQYLSNILNLMSSDVKSEKLRKFIIDGQKPEFKPTINKNVVTLCRPIMDSLNKSQRNAVLRSITAKDYTLICGTPGAGKTTTIVSIIRILVMLRKSVLITSYTHAALDNILLKLKHFDIDFVRLGIRSRIHNKIRKYSLENRMKHIKSVKESNEFYSNIPVVATTCLSLGHPIFEVRTFDYCLMDEASQVNLLASLGPLFLSKKFILVGDSKQLPPVVKSKEAKQMGFEESLFSILQNEETVNLTIQYRMNEEIMRVASKLTYDNLLECGSQQISTSTLTQRAGATFEKDWVKEVLSSELSKSVILVDTDKVPAPEEQDERGFIYNRVEAKLVTILVQHLISNYDLGSNEIGVITPYVKQVEVLREVCTNADVEINTVDQYQGRDKEAIIISTVVNSAEGTVKELLKDRRRLNVAITRAKKKLLIIGSRRTLSLYPPFKDLFSILKKHQFYTLPIGAHL